MNRRRFLELAAASTIAARVPLSLAEPAFTHQPYLPHPEIGYSVDFNVCPSRIEPYLFELFDFDQMFPADLFRSARLPSPDSPPFKLRGD